MSEPFTGEIRMFGGNFAPRGWALCDGQLLAVSQNDALFSLLGTIYGGDGRTTFGLPDLRGRVPIHYGSGPGLSPRSLGRKAGAESVTLTGVEARHKHSVHGSNNFGSDTSPANSVPATGSGTNLYNASPGTTTALDEDAVSNTGGSRSHTNLMPSLCVNFIIALFGIYPSRH